MQGFSDILGNEFIKERLKRETETGRLSHAYVLSGEKGIGKRTLAGALLLEVFRDREALVAAKSHPDIIYLRRAKESSIGVEEIRRQVVDTVDIRPFYHGKKAYVIEDAELMTPGAQNALLKTLEEPPEYALILLLANDETRLLDTLLSRSALIRLRPVPDEETERLLTGQGIDRADSELIARFARGNVGRAMALSSDEGFRAWRESLTRLMSGLGSKSQAEKRAELKELRELCPDIGEALDYLELLCHDALMAGGSGQEEIFKSIDMIEDTRNKLNAFVNPDVALLLLFDRIKEI